MSSLTHILLYLLFFFVAIDTSYKLQKMGFVSNSRFWNIVLFVVILFIVLEGCRYMRGPDWIAYKYRFEYISMDEPQKGFLYYMLFLQMLGFNYVGYFMANAALFIGCIFRFIRSTFDQRISSWMFLTAVLAMFYKFESQIRQYIAIPFIFLSIYCLVSKKWFFFFVLVCVSNSIHSGSLVLLAVFSVCFVLLKKTLPYQPLLVGLIISYFINSEALADYLASHLGNVNLNYISASNHFDTYIENYDRWLGAESHIIEMEQSFFAKIMQFVFELSCILSSSFSLKYLENNKLVITNSGVQLSDVEMHVLRSFFNISSLGFILDRLFYGYEIFHRMTGQLYILWFVPVGLSLYLFSIKENINRKYFKVFIYYILLYLCLYWGKFIFLNSTAKFVWN